MEAQQRSTTRLVTSQFCDLTYPRLRITDFTLDENLPTQPNYHICTSPKSISVPSIYFRSSFLQRILSQLDFRTLTDFQNVNQRAMRLVTSTPQYKTINTHTSNEIVGLLLSLACSSGLFPACWWLMSQGMTQISSYVIRICK
jgi:hypothetical protein